jgi:hypothetical protein
MNTGLTYEAGSSVQDDREGPLFGKIIKISGPAECLTQMFEQRDWFGPAGRSPQALAPSVCVPRQQRHKKQGVPTSVRIYLRV